MVKHGNSRYNLSSYRSSFNVGAAENVNTCDYRPQTDVPGTNDAMDDAAHVRFLLLIIPQRTGTVLGDLNPH